MKTTRLAGITLATLIGLGIQLSAPDAKAASGGIQFKFPVGLSYANGAYDVMDDLKASLNENGWTVDDDFVWPIGITFNPRIELPCGFGVGLAFGPTQVIVVDEHVHGGGWHSDDYNYNYVIPIGGYVQYNLFPGRSVSPFIRGGVRYPITGGDYLKDGSVSGFGAVGVEFLRNQKVAFGVEVGYDASEIKVNAGPASLDRTVKPIGFTVGVFVLF